MKTMSKLLAILMACMMLVGCVPALAEVPEGYPELRIDPATGKPYDLGGITVYMYSSVEHFNEDGSRNEPATPYEADTYDYQDWLFETYNFQFKNVKQHLYDDNAKALIDFASQETAPAPAFFEMVGWNMLSPMREGLLHDLSVFGVDLQDEERYQQAVVDTFTIDGKTYAMNNSFGIGPEAFYLFNKTLLADAGYSADQLYTWVVNGEWTWDKFEEVMDACTRDLDADGYIDQYGFTGNGQPEFVAAMASNGGSIFSIDENGKFYVSANEDAAVEALNWMDEMWHNYNTPIPAGANWDYYYELYKSGKAVFFFASTWEFQDDWSPLYGIWADDLFEVGAVPFPKGPGANAAHRAPLQGTNGYVIPANVPEEDAKKMMIAFDLINTPTPGYSEEDEIWKQGLYNIFMDEESVDITYAMLRESTYINFVPMLGVANDLQGADFIWSLMNSPVAGSYTVAELVEGKMPMWKTAIDKANGDYMAEVAE